MKKLIKEVKVSIMVNKNRRNSTIKANAPIVRLMNLDGACNTHVECVS